MHTTDATHTPLVAILNTTPGFIDLLTEALELEGFAVVADYIPEYRLGKKDIHAFLNKHRPHVVIYDIAIPYVENWEFFRQTCDASNLRECQFVIVTTNKDALESLVGETGSLEIIGKPFDLDTLIDGVNKSLDQCR